MAAAVATTHLGQVTTGHHSGGLVVDAALKASGAPVHELDGPLGLDGGHSCIDVLGYNITTVHQTASHVLAVAGVAPAGSGGPTSDSCTHIGSRNLLSQGTLSAHSK